VFWTPGACALLHSAGGAASRLSGGCSRRPGARGAPRTGVHRLRGPLEVEEEAEPVGKHGQRAARLLVPGDRVDVAQPLRVQLRAAAAHVHTHLRARGGGRSEPPARRRRAAGRPPGGRPPARRALPGTGLRGSRRAVLRGRACARWSCVCAGRARGRARSLPRSARWFIPESAQASYATSSSLRSCGSILCARRGARERQAAQADLKRPVRRSRPRSPPAPCTGEGLPSAAQRAACRARPSPFQQPLSSVRPVDRWAACCAPLREGGAPAPASRAPRRRMRRSGRTRPACRSAPACCAGRPASGGRPASPCPRRPAGWPRTATSSATRGTWRARVGASVSAAAPDRLAGARARAVRPLPASGGRPECEVHACRRVGSDLRGDLQV